MLTYRLRNARFGQNSNVIRKTIIGSRALHDPRSNTLNSGEQTTDLYVPLKLEAASTNRSEPDVRVGGVTIAATVEGSAAATGLP